MYYRMVYNVLLLVLGPQWVLCQSYHHSSIQQQIIINNIFLALGHRLTNSVIREAEVDTSLNCAHLCLSQWPKCKSINFQQTGSKCQLNSQRRTRRADTLVSDLGFNYFEKFPVSYNHILFVCNTVRGCQSQNRAQSVFFRSILFIVFICCILLFHTSLVEISYS